MRAPTGRELTDAAEAADAPCRNNPDLWFNQRSERDTTEAVRLCRTECDVREMCRAYAIATNQRYGVWGGLSSPDGYSLTGSRAGKL